MAANTKAVDKKSEEFEVISPWTLAWDRFRKNKLAVIGSVMFLIIIFLVVFGPMISPYDRDTLDFTSMKQPPSATHWFGTDELGRDYFTRWMYGGRISLMVGVIVTALSVIIGTIVGGVAGYFGGWVDNLLMRMTEIVAAWPFLALVITISAALQGRVPSDKKMYLVMMILGLIGWTGLARMIRGQILTLREQEFMEAAKALGISDTAQIFRYLIPNTLAYIIVFAMIRMGAAILSEAGLSFLGLGVTPPVPTWGNMIQYAKSSYNLKNLPWLWVPPGMGIFFAVMSINLLGEGLRDALDPKSK